VREALALASAAVDGRHADVIAHGEALLAGPDGAALAADPRTGRYVAGAILFASIAGHDPDAALRLQRDHWASLAPATRSDPALLLMLALATAPAPGSRIPAGLR
jgi:hypothetical protein